MNGDGGGVHILLPEPCTLFPNPGEERGRGRVGDNEAG